MTPTRDIGKLSPLSSSYPHTALVVFLLYAFVACSPRDNRRGPDQDTSLLRAVARPTIGKTYAECVQPIGDLRDHLREAGTRDGIRLRVADVSSPLEPAHFEIAGDDGGLAWASVILVPARHRRPGFPRVSTWAYGFLYRCGAEKYSQADDDWLDSSYVQLERAPGDRTRDLGPRRITLSRQKGDVNMLLTIRPRA